MNQNQLVMTRGDDRTFALIVDDDYEGDTATFRVDGLFDKSLTVDAEPGSGLATATVEVASADTEDSPDDRTSYRYELSVVHDGDTLTIRKGRFIVLPDLTAP